jgi:hypothetical protein
MESALGTPLPSVRVFDGAESANAARSLGARAFTDGMSGDVHFASGQYAPGTREGDRLLLHELAHVAQAQRGGGAIHRKADDDHDADLDVSRPDDAAEVEADAIADHSVSRLHDGQRGATAPRPPSATLGGLERKLHLTPEGPPDRAPAGGAPTGAPTSQAAPGATNTNQASQTAGVPQTAPQNAPGESNAGAPTRPPLEVVQQACAGDPIASQKVQDVLTETQPKAAALKDEFFAGVAKRLEAKPDLPGLNALRDEVSVGDKYILKGEKIPQAEILKVNGVGRMLDLKSVFDRYLAPDYKKKIGGDGPDGYASFLRDVKAGGFDPMRHMDESAKLRGRALETWWFANSEVKSVNIEGVIKELTLEAYPQYQDGAVRLDLTPADVEAFGGIHKPTAFDGIMQGENGDPMWARAPGVWGETRDGHVKEAVVKLMELSTVKNRTLVMPSAVPEAPARAGDAGTADNATPGGSGAAGPPTV